jgi:hypothetical protein
MWAGFSACRGTTCEGLLAIVAALLGGPSRRQYSTRATQAEALLTERMRADAERDRRGLGKDTDAVRPLLRPARRFAVEGRSDTRAGMHACGTNRWR